MAVREPPGQLKGSGAEPGVWNRWGLPIKPEQFVTSLAIPAQLKERKMRERVVRAQGWEGLSLPDHQPCLFPPRRPSYPSDTPSLILSTVPISPTPSPQSSRMPWASLLCPPWPSPRPFPPPGFCPGLSLCREPLTCCSCSFPQGFCSPGGGGSLCPGC